MLSIRASLRYIDIVISMTASLQQLIATEELLKRAYEFAKNAHTGEKRLNGEPFFNHCLATAEKLMSWNQDSATIAAGLLHHVPERHKNKEQALQKLKQEFSPEISELVQGIINVSSLPYHGTEHQIQNLRKFIFFLSRDVRVIIAKLASALNSLQSLYSLSAEIQKRKSLKAIEIYAPIARQIGMSAVAGDLEDLVFPYLYPKDYNWIITNVTSYYEDRKNYLERVKPLIAQELEANGVNIVKIDSRPKHYFSLYKKLLRYEMNLEKIYDLVAARVIVPEISDCYAALGVIHKTWPPLPGRIKDYIAAPKANGYRSLHTTIYGPENQLSEIQIRTEEMHREAELGIAAHFTYAGFKGTRSYLSRISAVADPKELLIMEELSESRTKLHEISFFKNRILVLSPKGDVFDLPAESTPLDFAYKVHTEIGNHTVGAKVNNRMVPLATPLKSGDVVEIITHRKKKPSLAWLSIVKSSQAREKIKSALHHQTVNSSLIEGPKTTEIKISILEQPGLAKEITGLLHKAKAKPAAITIQPATGKNSIQSIKITLPVLHKSAVKKLSEKIKKLTGFKSLTFRNL